MFEEAATRRSGMTEPKLTSGGFALLHESLTAPPFHVPDGKGGAFKTELVIERTPDRTVKIFWWHADDPRPEPHNHPWDFRSEILYGGYSEQRFEVLDNGISISVATYRPGEVNVVPMSVFHNVSDVLPGTVTRMTCGPAVPGNVWHYLDLETLGLLDSADPTFRPQLQAINPHLRHGRPGGRPSTIATARAPEEEQ